RAHRLALRIEEAARLGEVQPEEVQPLANEAGLGPSEVRQIRQHLKETRNLAPEQAGLYLRASRLPLEDFFKVYDGATASERSALAPLLTKKSHAYIKR